VRPLTRALFGVGLLLAARPVMGRLEHRVPAFEPTDLDLEDPRTVDLDLQVGVVLRDEEPKRRIYVPDFELDLGLTHGYGTGFGAVLLAARMEAPLHVIANAGVVTEPLDHTEPRRSAGVLGGLDLDYDLSLVGFYGFLPGGDRGGVFLGLAPKWSFARAP
jgi:hypothetical protein